MLAIKKLPVAAVLLLLNQIKGQKVKKRRIGNTAIAVVATLLVLCQVAYAQDIEVSVRTTDASGAPMAGVDVATGWWVTDGKLTPDRWNATTDASGRATIKMPKPAVPVLLFAYDKERRQAACATIQLGANEVEISLLPASVVKQKMTLKDKADFFPEGAFNFLFKHPHGTLANGTASFWGGGDISPDNEIPLPAGSYLIRGWLHNEAVGRLAGEFKLDPGQSLTLDPVDIELSAVGKNYGKPALPISVSEARGLNKPFRLEDYRGKWVFLEFWHRQCAPCIGRSLPAMMALYDKHTDKRDKFEIFAFHGPTVKTLTELDTYLPKISENAWSGRSLPFPILMDASGETVKTWGVKGYPSEILIDPQGRIVRTQDAKKYLEEQLMKR